LVLISKYLNEIYSFGLNPKSYLVFEEPSFINFDCYNNNYLNGCGIYGSCVEVDKCVCIGDYIIGEKCELNFWLIILIVFIFVVLFLLLLLIFVISSLVYEN
jgi:hypothetical protein